MEAGKGGRVGGGVRVGTNKTESYRKAYTTSHLLRPRLLQSFWGHVRRGSGASIPRNDRPAHRRNSWGHGRPPPGGGSRPRLRPLLPLPHQGGLLYTGQEGHLYINVPYIYTTTNVVMVRHRTEPIRFRTTVQWASYRSIWWGRWLIICPLPDSTFTTLFAISCTLFVTYWLTAPVSAYAQPTRKFSMTKIRTKIERKEYF